MSHDSMPSLSHRLIAEGLGTFALVFAGTGAIATNSVTGAVTHVGVALVFGLVVVAMIAAIGDVSGAHLNPAVTFGFVLARRLPVRVAVPYAATQCAAAIAASAAVSALFPAGAALGVTRPHLIGPGACFALETLLTAGLMFVILGVTCGSEEKGLTASLAIGGTVGLEALFAGPLTGASMNPARSLGPAVIAGEWRDLWIYFAAPLLGVIVAVACNAATRACGCHPWAASEEVR
jgi:aquaporin Z